MLQTTNTIAFINSNLNAQRYRDEILGPIVLPFIRRHHLMFQQIMLGSMLQGSVHNSWKLKMSPFFHSLHTYKRCHPLSLFGMLWFDMYNNVFQFLPISSYFEQPLKRSGTTFHRPQSTA
jgi:hypothetical protein